MGSLLADRFQQLGEEAVNLLFHLDELSCPTPAVPPQRFGDQRQPHPFVRLATRHGSLRQQDEMAATARRIVEETHQVDAVPSCAITNGVRGSQLP